jgi:hypothetical protein
MALPPEPIEEVLPKAKWVVDAEVKEVTGHGPAPDRIDAPPGHTSVGNKAPAQLITLTIKRVLRGDPGAKELTVEKPAAGYALREGNKGPFLLDEGSPTPLILGRYGPDTYSWEKIERALQTYPFGKGS